MLPEVAFDGWSRPALRAGGAARRHYRSARRWRCFPAAPPISSPDSAAGPIARMLDRLEATAARPVARARAHRAGGRRPASTSSRRGARRCGARLSVLALPQHAPLALRLLYETVDAHLVRRRRRAPPISAFIQSGDPRRDLCRDGALLARGPLGGLCRHARFFRPPPRRCSPHRRRAHRLESALDRLPNPLRLLRPLR